ncbi:hypothetical protein EPA93_12245 [Ktedonosporobacter rubrisoli]|uniref:Aminoglycoside phosphotransferase domain-containing protein n=1 Tax=Ktedonosporobacter rubrisoli TaxID=2509675 RepID=A0A4P6JNJ0_KTERU|nr:phosphotransferase [Ktedonosporobacter rubrisoli]QBD76733.1 hypothetical protein EPA93_12245 [Ktedonosporobacter rubrisoli]
MKLTELLQRLNALHQTSFTSFEKFPVGEQGAYTITDQTGKKYVLKWAPGAKNLSWMQKAKTVTELLRSLDYPASHYLFIGGLPEGIYSIQDVLPGSPIQTMTPALLPRLFELNRLQLGRAISGRTDWHQEVVKTVLLGGDGYCIHTSLQQHSQVTVDILRTLQSLVTAYRDEPHSSNDIVHGDFQHANILVQDEQISGVVDWDSFGAGDCIFDIATLLFYAYDNLKVRKQLWDYALSQASLKLLSIYLAHMILRQIDWSLCYHDQSTGEHYIKRGQMLLQEITYRLNLA